MQFELHSYARMQFGPAIADARELLKFHDSEARKTPGRPSPQLEVFKRASLILTVTAWESFVENSLRYAANVRFAALTRPSDMPSAFNIVAREWLDEKKNSVAALEAFCDEGWKASIRKRLDLDISQLHTPSAKNIAELSKRYIGEDITVIWKWQGSPNAKVKSRLDELIRHRGDLVHQGRGIKFETYPKADVRKDQVEAAIALVVRLADLTDRHFHPSHYATIA